MFKSAKETFADKKKSTMSMSKKFTRVVINRYARQLKSAFLKLAKAFPRPWLCQSLDTEAVFHGTVTTCVQR